MKIFKSKSILVLFIFFSSPVLGPEKIYAQNKPPISITVNTTNVTGPIEHIWNGIGGSLGHALTPEGNRIYQRIAAASPFPFYKRCWGITENGIGGLSTLEADYGSTNVYQVDKNGRPLYDFSLFDQVFDVIMSQKFIPIMHVGSMPDSLSSAPVTTLQKKEELVKYPPKDYDKWYDLVFNIVKHSVVRYGKEEVARWKWELWNEPDIAGYWKGTEEEYIKLYDYTASAIKSALPETQVGGNSVTHSGTRGTPFLIRFIEHCIRGTNNKDSSVGAPLDFISFHLKGTNFAIYKIGNFTSEKLPPDIPRFSPNLQFLLGCAKNNLEKISSVPGSAGIPVYITECDIDIGLTISKHENPNVEYRNTEYYPVFQCALAKEMLDICKIYPANPVKCYAIDALYYPGYRIFEGQRALFTAEEIEVPIFNAFRLLGKLGTERLQVELSKNDNVDGLATRNDKNIQVMIYNYHNDVGYKESRKAELSVILPSSKSYRLSHYRIDENHSNAYSVWKSLGKPLAPNDNQMHQIKSRQGLELFEPEKIINPSKDKIMIPLELPHHSVSLLVFEPIK